MRRSSVRPVFSDEVVTTTELSRRVKEITQKALRQPVTIHRPEGDLAMMSRSEVADMMALTAASESLLDFAKNLARMLKGTDRPMPGWEWLRVFSPEDVADFLEEYTSAMEQAITGQADWSRVGDVLYEWQESGRAMNHRPLLAEVALSRGLASEEAERLTAEELRRRLYAVQESHSVDDR